MQNWIPRDVVEPIENSNLDEVVFSDPFSAETRRAKRSLLIASFICLLIATLKVQITGFLGITTIPGNPVIGNELALGLASIVVLYMLVAFLSHAFVDYSAWKFELERKATTPYLGVIALLAMNYKGLGQQIGDATGQNPEKLEAVKTRIEELRSQFAPLLHHWQQTINTMNRLTWRLRARFAQLWALDLLVPIALASLAIWKSAPHIITLGKQLFS